jgi:hypothetical protein
VFLLGAVGTVLWYRRLGPDAFARPADDEPAAAEPSAADEVQVVDADAESEPTEPAGRPS